MGELAAGTHIAEWQLAILRTCALARCHEGAASLLRVFLAFLFDGLLQSGNCVSIGLSSYGTLLWHEF